MPSTSTMPFATPVAAMFTVARADASDATLRPVDVVCDGEFVGAQPKAARPASAADPPMNRRRVSRYEIPIWLPAARSASSYGSGGGAFSSQKETPARSGRARVDQLGGGGSGDEPRSRGS